MRQTSLRLPGASESISGFRVTLDSDCVFGKRNIDFETAWWIKSNNGREKIECTKER